MEHTVLYLSFSKNPIQTQFSCSFHLYCQLRWKFVTSLKIKRGVQCRLQAQGCEWLTAWERQKTIYLKTIFSLFFLLIIFSWEKTMQKKNKLSNSYFMANMKFNFFLLQVFVRDFRQHLLKQQNLAIYSILKNP